MTRIGPKSGCWIAVIMLTLTACDSKPTSIDLCQETVSNYAWLRDSPDQADAYAALFSKNGTFTLAGQVIEGREALANRHRIANQNAVWRHNMIDVEVADKDGTLSGQTRFIVQTGPRSDRPGPVTREIVGSYTDVFEIVGDKCLIKSRLVSVDFDTKTEVRKD